LNDEEHYHDMLDDSGQDGYTLHERMPLPKRLSKCLQDVDVHGIKIRHKVKFNIALHNPDGHVSEVRLPFVLPKRVHTDTDSFVPRFQSLFSSHLTCLLLPTVV